MQKSVCQLNIGLVVLSSDYRVIGMNAYARQVFKPLISNLGKSVYNCHSKKTHTKVQKLLQAATNSHNIPAVMVIDVLDKILLINVCRMNVEDISPEPFFAMNFIDVTEKTETEQERAMVEIKKIPVYEKGMYLFLDVSSIYVIQCEGNYCKVFTENSLFYLRLTLRDMQKRYKEKNLFRVHRSFIVNLDRVHKIKQDEKGHAFIIFDKEHIPFVPVAKRRISALKKTLDLF